jgi:phage shock protein PspC (stress-responsive transcriptional regulator)
MTTTDPFGGFPPPAPSNPQAAAPPPRGQSLRRSRTDRVGAGVAGGLGEYFGVDPVLFRVLFATASFFGGAGVLAYLLAWAAIPESGTVSAPIDRWLAELRRHRIPFWLVAGVGALLLWGIAFSWWAPGPSFPIIVIVIVLVAIFGRRARISPPTGQSTGPASDPAAPGAAGAGLVEPSAVATEQTINLSKVSEDGSTDPSGSDLDATRTLPAGAAGSGQGYPADPTPGAATAPSWVTDAREWISESRAASRARRRRAMPVKIAGIATLAVTLVILGLIDALSGIVMPAYFWATFGITGVALLTGLVLRRTPWSLTPLLVLGILGLIAFGNTHSSLHDGIGQKQWRPSTAHSETSYRLAIGHGVLDLRALPTLTAPETIDVTMAAGQIHVIAPRSMAVDVRAEIHLGNLTVDGVDYNSGDGGSSRGINVDRTVPADAGATGAPLLVRVHLADGNVSVTRP